MYTDIYIYPYEDTPQLGCGDGTYLWMLEYYMLGYVDMTSWHAVGVAPVYELQVGPSVVHSNVE